MKASIPTNLAQDFLEKLGFSPEEIKLYLTLAQSGQATLLATARNSGIERTKLYRLIEDLKEKGIIEEVPQFKRKTIKAADLSTIELLVKEKERQAKFLTTTYPSFAESLKDISKPFPGNNVIYYKGKEGMRQMAWHILRCKGLFRTYSYCFWNDILGDAFVLKLNQELVERKFQVHDLYSDEYIKFKKNWLKNGKRRPEGNWAFWDSRYLPEKLVTVHLNIDIYNDVVAYYYWEGEEIFGVEIYNERVANIQKQIHDVLWKMSKKKPHIMWTDHGLK
ncbi:hypothetical protein A2160_05315 [Candidatus Beckwithbacteria bacterium RBG_13_42_9]|uniref:Transcription regulator TrmB N-terminal domain-containing protein n=1 Tax=Candidatus Beckwithbacteria bacterium RBG_13_42_9 TaxID=1797457 RepID=A0A1F5E6N5_9BACT|nr:MAG: hypothetical protein A2160_05315 [Candidatus Beckwithbacteria bacterium RBG_13_42_9]